MLPWLVRSMAWSSLEMPRCYQSMISGTTFSMSTRRKELWWKVHRSHSSRLATSFFGDQWNTIQINETSSWPNLLSAASISSKASQKMNWTSTSKATFQKPNPRYPTETDTASSQHPTANSFLSRSHLKEHDRADCDGHAWLRVRKLPHRISHMCSWKTLIVQHWTNMLVADMLENYNHFRNFWDANLLRFPTVATK